MEVAAKPKDEIPADRLDEVLKANLEGLGHMERYEYRDAVTSFRIVHKVAPGWLPGSINLSIALLNNVGEEAEEAKQKGGGYRANFDEALELLGTVLASDPNEDEALHAHYCRGLILEYVGEYQKAHDDFQFVVEHDPTDAHAWWKLGSTLTDPDRPRFPANPAKPEQSKKLIEYYTKALERDPYLVRALYKLQRTYIAAGQRQDYNRVFAMWRQLNPALSVTGSGDDAGDAYGETGKYARVMHPGLQRNDEKQAVSPPRFEPPARLTIKLPEGDRWSQASDFEGSLEVVGRARSRFGAAVAAFDANSDGKLDLYLAGAVKGASGQVRDALLLNKGDGTFEDATAAWQVPTDRVSLGVAAGDFDADGAIDLFLSGAGDNRLLRNTGQGAFEDLTKAALGQGAQQTLSLRAMWLDLDQDGDLDLYVVNYCEAKDADKAFRRGEETPPGIANAVYRNDGVPAEVPGAPKNAWAPAAVTTESIEARGGLSIELTSWKTPEAQLLPGGDAAHTNVAALDVDDDRDIDLVLTADGVPPRAILNDRLGVFHDRELKDLADGGPLNGLIVADFDEDGRPDLAAVPATGRLRIWRNRLVVQEAARDFAFEFFPTDAHDWRTGLLADLDLDGAFDLIGVSDDPEEGVSWARNEGNALQASPLALGPGGMSKVLGLLEVDVTGDPLPDLVVLRDGETPWISKNLGNGNSWLALDFSGRWKLGPIGGPMRTNPQGLGVKLLVQGVGFEVPYHHTTTTTALVQSVTPVVLGLGNQSRAELVRLTWPDGVLQCELNEPANQLIAMSEYSRKTGSCPVLFTWNGERFVCLGDFLGGGGLGYLVAPGVYGDPDRDESVAIEPDQLREVDGVFRLSITEPMDEIAYLDRLTLDVVDRPPGVETVLDERFAPSGPRPSGAILPYRERIDPIQARDLKGNDLTETLRSWDRKTADRFAKLGVWIGYATEHGIVLDFGDRLARFGPEDHVVLCLAGWVEYPYSQTNYAAATAGVSLRPPVLERQMDDGTWTVIDPSPGYPAGLPRRMTVDLTGKVGGPSCVLRLRTNMECYYDEAFIAVVEPGAGTRVNSLEVARAQLGPRGYTREVSPDGRPPLIYDYDYIDPAPLASFRGALTRFGDVVPLLRGDDDRLCLVGPGDEVRLEFDASGIPPLTEGWTRSYVLRAVGYCKDADPFTAGSDEVGPLPWKGMPAFPFSGDGERPHDEAYDRYLREYQTRFNGN